MAAWLLAHFSTWMLAVVIVGGVTAAAVAGCAVVRRTIPSLTGGDYNELSGVLLGVFAAIYGVLLAFVIVILWESRDAADAAVASEGASLSQLVQDSDGFAGGDAVRSAVADYVRVAVDDEWPAMSRGEESVAADQAMTRLLAAVRTHVPKSSAEAVYYQDAVSSANQASNDRQSRLDAASSGLPTLFTVLIVAGASVFVPMTYLFGIRRRAAQFGFVGFCAVMIAVGLLLMVILDRPFTGALAVDPGALQQGVLAQFWPST